jgi:hypothetical protein
VLSLMFSGYPRESVFLLFLLRGFKPTFEVFFYINFLSLSQLKSSHHCIKKSRKEHTKKNSITLACELFKI